MNFKILFNKNDELTYRLLMLFEQKSALPIETIVKTLGVSSYTLNKTIEKAQKDLALQKEYKSNLREDNAGNLRFEQFNLAQIQELAVIYLERSSQYQILKFRYFNFNELTISQFIESLYLGKTAYYQQVKLLNQKLDRMDFKKGQKSPDDENQIRINLYRLLFPAYAGTQDFYANLNSLCDQIIKIFVSGDRLTKEPVLYNKCMFFLKLSLLRVHKGHNIQTAPLALQSFYQNEATDMRKLINEALSVDLSPVEIDYWLSFLASQEVIDVKAPIVDDKRQTCRELTRQLEQALLNSEILKAPSKINFDGLTKRLDTIHLQVVTIFIEPISTNFNEELSYLSRNYPMLAKFVSDYFQLSKTNADSIIPSLGEDAQKSLYLLYTFTLIDFVNFDQLYGKIEVCINVSAGRVYQEHFKNLLAENSTGEIKLTTLLTSKV